MAVYISEFLTYDNPILKYVCLFRNYDFTYLCPRLLTWQYDRHDENHKFQRFLKCTDNFSEIWAALNQSVYGGKKSNRNQVTYLCIGKLSRHLFRFNANPLFVPILDWCYLDPRGQMSVAFESKYNNIHTTMSLQISYVHWQQYV